MKIKRKEAETIGLIATYDECCDCFECYCPMDSVECRCNISGETIRDTNICLALNEDYIKNVKGDKFYEELKDAIHHNRLIIV